MSKRKAIFIGGMALLVVALLGISLSGLGTTAVWAQTAPGPVGGMMGGNGQVGPGGMMGGWSGQSGTGGMMGGWTGQNPQSQPIGLDRAADAVKAYVSRTGNQDLAVDEVMEFQYNFYAIVKETSTGTGAFELLVNKYSGFVYPEMGPNTMWNTKYGMMSSNGQSVMGGNRSGMMGGGMMGGNGWGGMMGGWNGTSQANGQPTVSLEDAQTAAQRWLDQNQPGSSTESPDQFYGYYTVHTLKDGKVSGMLSVNAYTGVIWYHSWHGAFVQLMELAG
ncbi:MAG: hypothetical protein ACYC4L_01505 [Chloroflexota bacterium]